MISPVNDLRTIGALAERLNAGAKHPTFTEYSLRHYVRNADSNGLEPAVKRIGRKILVSESGFISWIEGHGFSQDGEPKKKKRKSKTLYAPRETEILDDDMEV